MKKYYLYICTFIISLCSFFIFSDHVYAYDSVSNYYPFVSDLYSVFFNSNKTQVYTELSYPSNGTYNLNNNNLSDIHWITSYVNNTGNIYTFPFRPDIFDYYLIGNIVALSQVDTSFDFKPNVIQLNYRNLDENSNYDYQLSDLYVYDINSSMYKGFGFYEKVDFESADNIGINYVTFQNDDNFVGNLPAKVSIQLGIMAVEKESSEVDSLTSILLQLQNMESSLNSSLGSIDNSIDSGVNSITNGYSDTTVDSATDEFNDSASELEDIESDLSSTSNDNVSSFTDTFDDSIVVNLGSSLVYVVTWFSNFWNLGGLFTQLLSVSLALYVAFFIIFRRG